MHPQIILTLTPQGGQLQVPPNMTREALITLLLDTVKTVACSPPPKPAPGIEIPPGDVASKLLAAPMG